MMTTFKPEMRDGVSPSCVYLPANGSGNTAQPWLTILDFLIEKFPQISMEIWQQRINQGKVFDQSGLLVSSDTPYQPYSKVYYYRELEQEIPIPFEEKILFQNEHLLVVDKPHFLPVSPTGRFVKESLLVRLKQQFGLPEITPIHRLDRETAGVMLFSKQPETRHLYQLLFQNRQVNKTYQAIAPYHPALTFPLNHQSRMVKGTPFFIMQEIAGEPNSFTTIELMERQENLARYQLHPVSGKQHQLRVHMAALGIPILNDSFYPQLIKKAESDFTMPLQLLAHSIAFIDPITQQPVKYYSQQVLNF